MAADRLLAASINATADAVAAEAIDLLLRAGIPSMLLKGTPLSTWLGDQLRASADVDLLVRVRDTKGASDALRAIGYRQWLAGDATTIHATTWGRSSLAMPIDVHTTVIGATCTPEEFWEALWADAETVAVGSVDAQIPSVAARLTLLALHAAQHGAAEASTLHDLSLGISKGGDEQWPMALAVATRIGAVEAFSAGLRLVP